MPRKFRIDAPGALHHIVVREIEQRKIFLDDLDRENFIERVGMVLTESHTPCFAWALIPNHVHLLLRTGTTPSFSAEKLKIHPAIIAGRIRYEQKTKSRTCWLRRLPLADLSCFQMETI